METGIKTGVIGLFLYSLKFSYTYIFISILILSEIIKSRPVTNLSNTSLEEEDKMFAK